MSIEKQQTKQQQAHEALDTIQQMQRISLQRAKPPLWFAIVISLITGVMAALSAAGSSRLYLAPLFLLMIFIIFYQFRRAGVTLRVERLVRLFSSKQQIIMLAVSLLAGFVLLVLPVRLLSETMDIPWWLHLSVGLIATLATNFMFVLERRMYDIWINAEKVE